MKKMKKITAILMATLLIMSGFCAFAAESSQMEKVLGIVKTRITIPEELTEFIYSSENYNTREIFNFSWNTPDSGAYLGISCDVNGVVTSYHFYENNKAYYNEPTAKLPVYSITDCKKIAAEFFQKVNPDIYEKFKLIDERTDFRLGLDTYFNYSRVENGIPLDTDYATVSINSETGKVNYYNASYTEIKEFPNPDKAITKEAAIKAYGEKIGMHLVYNVEWKDNKPVPVLEYIPKGTSNERINAMTGEVFVPTSDDSRLYEAGMAYDVANEKSMTMGGMGEAPTPTFTPQELESIDANSGLLSAEQAVNKLREIKILDIPKDAKITYSNINKSNNGYTMNLSLEAKASMKGLSAEKVKLMEASGDTLDYIYAVLDAKTGQLFIFNRNQRYNEPDKANEADASKIEKASIDAAKILLGDKFSEFKVYSNEIMDFKAALSSSYIGSLYRNGVTLNRMVNDIPYMGNQCMIYANPETGFVENFNYSYDNMEFPSADGIISLDEALKAAFSGGEYILRYVPSTYNYYSDDKPIEVSLVYSFENYPVIDAKTGKFKSYVMEFISENGGEYTDIENHWANEAIEKLAEHGIYFEGSEFRPEDKMLQKDYITLLTIIFGRNSVEVLRDKMANVYQNYFIGNILDKSEENPTAEVTRFDAVKFMIRGMGAEEYAKLSNIYKTPFNDVTENEGYVALALGLKLISPSDNFKPDSSLTRAEAICMVYNYLNR